MTAVLRWDSRTLVRNVESWALSFEPLLECFKNHVLPLGKLWQNNKAQKHVDMAWCLVW